MNILDPTFSRTTRDDYTRILQNIVGGFNVLVMKNADRVWKGLSSLPLESDVFSKNRSFDSGKLIQSLNTKISLEEQVVIRRAIRFQSLMGVKLALSQAYKGKPHRGFGGEYINQGTFEVLAGVNVDLVKSIKQDQLKRLKLYLARFVGGGVLTWHQLKQHVKKLGNFSMKKAEQIARTEVIRTISTMQKETLLMLGKKKWKWVTAYDDKVCQVCGPLEGKVVEIGKPFRTWRGEPVINSPVHPYCRCSQEVV